MLGGCADSEQLQIKKLCPLNPRENCHRYLLISEDERGGVPNWMWFIAVLVTLRASSIRQLL